MCNPCLSLEPVIHGYWKMRKKVISKNFQYPAMGPRVEGGGGVGVEGRDEDINFPT